MAYHHVLTVVLLTRFMATASDGAVHTLEYFSNNVIWNNFSLIFPAIITLIAVGGLAIILAAIEFAFTMIVFFVSCFPGFSFTGTFASGHGLGNIYPITAGLGLINYQSGETAAFAENKTPAAKANTKTRNIK